MNEVRIMKNILHLFLAVIFWPAMLTQVSSFEGIDPTLIN